MEAAQVAARPHHMDFESFTIPALTNCSDPQFSSSLTSIAKFPRTSDTLSSSMSPVASDVASLTGTGNIESSEAEASVVLESKAINTWPTESHAEK